MKVPISAILRHIRLKFGIQIPLDLRNEFFLAARWIWLPWQHKEFHLVSHDISKFGLLGKNVFHGNKIENQYLSRVEVYKVRIFSPEACKRRILLPFSNKNAKYA